MSKPIVKILLSLVATFLFAGTLSAQVQNNRRDNDSQEVKLQWEKIFASANETAIFDNEKLSFVKLPISNDEVKLFTFDHAEDGKSFTLIDENAIRLQVSTGEDKRIQSIVMPDGKKAIFHWKQNSNGHWITESIKFEGSNTLRVCLTNGILENTVCRDAAAAATIALGICAATGGASVPCWGATATAAYLAYKCYEKTRAFEEFEVLEAYINPKNKLTYKSYARQHKAEQKYLNRGIDFRTIRSI